MASAPGVAEPVSPQYIWGRSANAAAARAVADVAAATDSRWPMADGRWRRAIADGASIWLLGAALLLASDGP